MAGEPVVSKHRFDAFFRTDLDVLLRAKGIQTIMATGVTTDCCVESTVRDAFFRDCFVVVPRECVATSYTPARSDQALERIDRLFGKVVSLEDIEAEWSGAEQREGYEDAAAS